GRARSGVGSDGSATELGAAVVGGRGAAVGRRPGGRAAHRDRARGRRRPGVGRLQRHRAGAQHLPDRDLGQLAVHRPGPGPVRRPGRPVRRRGRRGHRAPGRHAGRPPPVPGVRGGRGRARRAQLAVGPAARPAAARRPQLLRDRPGRVRVRPGPGGRRAAGPLRGHPAPRRLGGDGAGDRRGRPRGRPLPADPDGAGAGRADGRRGAQPLRGLPAAGAPVPGREPQHPRRGRRRAGPRGPYRPRGPYGGVM
ncbi:MAG: hypothetical protein AVDCRST_MAG41-3172, partial [uncultured Corynebacteriales bacterium]